MTLAAFEIANPYDPSEERPRLAQSIGNDMLGNFDFDSFFSGTGWAGLANNGAVAATAVDGSTGQHMPMINGIDFMTQFNDRSGSMNGPASTGPFND